MQISIVTAGLLFQSQQFDINSSHKFLLKNVSMSTFSAASLLRLELIMLPDVLNTRSDATLVAAMHRYFIP